MVPVPSYAFSLRVDRVRLPSSPSTREPLSRPGELSAPRCELNRTPNSMAHGHPPLWTHRRANWQNALPIHGPRAGSPQSEAQLVTILGAPVCWYVSVNDFPFAPNRLIHCSQLSTDPNCLLLKVTDLGLESQNLWGLTDRYRSYSLVKMSTSATLTLLFGRFYESLKHVQEFNRPLLT